MASFNKPELVSPAGDWPSLLAALESGADAVYFGLQGLNMRQGARNFDSQEIPKIMDCLHRRKAKGYLALNVLIHNADLKKTEKVIKSAYKSGVDALVVWDMAVLSMARALGLRVHLSTQASVANNAAFAFYAQQGVRRVILARECSLDQIRQVIRFRRANSINCEIETFIHGAMCLSLSGRCLLSHEAFGKSANKGECLQPCRREYLIKEAGSEREYVLGQDYILSPRDLCAIDFLDKLIQAGIDSFKIEGRMRSAEYVKTTTAVYRRAIDAFFEGAWGEELKKKSKEELRTVYNRGFCDGFFWDIPKGTSAGLEHTHQKVFLGEVRKFFPRLGVAQIAVQKEGLSCGQTVLFIGKKTPACRSVVEEMQKDHQPVQRVSPGEAVGLKLPFAVRPRDKVFLWKEHFGFPR